MIVSVLVWLLVLLLGQAPAAPSAHRHGHRQAVRTPAPTVSPEASRGLRPPLTRRLAVTAYCLQGTMADGQTTFVGAAASNLFPFGTRLVVPGFGPVVVADRTDGRTDVDLFFGADAGCVPRALTWGRRTVQAAIFFQEP